MKKITSLLLFLFFVATMFAQKEMPCTITNADLYLSGAELYAKGAISLEKGTHTLVVKNITACMMQNTLKVKTSQGVNLLSINTMIDHTSSTTYNEKEQKLIDREKEIAKEKKMLTIDQTTLTEEMQIIDLHIRNNSEKSEKGQSLEDIKTLISYYSNQRKEIRLKKYNIEQKISVLDKELEKIRLQLAEETAYKNRNNMQIEMIVEATAPGSKQFEISYFVNNCGWNPLYDIKADSKEKPITFVYKANVWQTTGTDWDNIAISLKSSQPSQNQNRPILSPQYVDFGGSYDRFGNGISMSESTRNSLELSQGTYALNAAAVQSDINISYDIPGKQTIKGSGKPSVIHVSKQEVNGRFVYHTVPKVNEKVFLIAYIPQWQNLNLISGNASVYLSDAYIGEIYLNEKFTATEYPVSFGEDKRIVVKRMREQYNVIENKLSNEKRVQTEYKIIVRNQLKTDMNIEVLDQIPISNQNTIKVILTKQGDAELTENIGLLKWNISLKAGETKEMGFGYEIRHPKEKNIQIK
ncbi:mucoidy inhibitor MuiA family protein [Bacteroidales bacterium OttesenSCG-928-B11]|nr:mucoidy inhibitor MuiA family protein [Bacteroidales bacterium OttesenSCG-928-C03]MDL2311663.1 mucoidy inhibitor MuiA family protein [Bacteroidales bacterium OttesenSCG-928-B11]MDL2325766.1 mucoidy inhibitor MuiA family protein [Bacteroidales bacterium OttesenSCG-928-A14]